MQLRNARGSFLKVRIERDDAAGTWQIITPVWKMQPEPFSTIPGWIVFYRHLTERKGGVFAQYYRDTLKAIEALQRDLRRDS